MHTVPDPYYVTNAFEQSTDNKIIKFVNLPQKAIIRIYSSSGVLVQLLEHNSTTFGGEETLGRAEPEQPGGRQRRVLLSHRSHGASARRVGRMTIVNFAQ